MKAMYLIAGNDASPFHMQTYLKPRRGVPAGLYCMSRKRACRHRQAFFFSIPDIFPKFME